MMHRETFARRWSVGEQHVEGDNTQGRSNVSLGPHSMREMKDISQELEWHMKEQQHESAATDSGRVVSGVTILLKEWSRVRAVQRVDACLSNTAFQRVTACPGHTETCQKKESGTLEFEAWLDVRNFRIL